MSAEEKDLMILLDKKIDESDFLDLATLGNEVLVKLSKHEVKKDKRDNESLYLTLETEDKKRIVQKYTPTTYKHLTEKIKKSGGLSVLKDKFSIWKKERIGRNIYDRLYPVGK